MFDAENAQCIFTGKKKTDGKTLISSGAEIFTFIHPEIIQFKEQKFQV